MAKKILAFLLALATILFTLPVYAQSWYLYVDPPGRETGILMSQDGINAKCLTSPSIYSGVDCVRIPKNQSKAEMQAQIAKIGNGNTALVCNSEFYVRRWGQVDSNDFKHWCNAFSQNRIDLTKPVVGAPSTSSSENNCQNVVTSTSGEKWVLFVAPYARETGILIAEKGNGDKSAKCIVSKDDEKDCLRVPKNSTPSQLSAIVAEVGRTNDVLVCNSAKYTTLWGEVYNPTDHSHWCNSFTKGKASTTCDAQTCSNIVTSTSGEKWTLFVDPFLRETGILIAEKGNGDKSAKCIVSKDDEKDCLRVPKNSTTTQLSAIVAEVGRTNDVLVCNSVKYTNLWRVAYNPSDYSHWCNAFITGQVSTTCKLADNKCSNPGIDWYVFRNTVVSVNKKGVAQCLALEMKSKSPNENSKGCLQIPPNSKNDDLRNLLLRVGTDYDRNLKLAIYYCTPEEFSNNFDRSDYKHPEHWCTAFVNIKDRITPFTNVPDSSCSAPSSY